MIYCFHWDELTEENFFDVTDEETVLLSSCTNDEEIPIGFENCIYNDIGTEQTIMT